MYTICKIYNWIFTFFTWFIIYCFATIIYTLFTCIFGIEDWKFLLYKIIALIIMLIIHYPMFRLYEYSKAKEKYLLKSYIIETLITLNKNNK